MKQLLSRDVNTMQQHTVMLLKDTHQFMEEEVGRITAGG